MAERGGVGWFDPRRLRRCLGTPRESVREPRQTRETAERIARLRRSLGDRDRIPRPERPAASQVIPNGARQCCQLVNAREGSASTALTSKKGFQQSGAFLQDQGEGRRSRSGSPPLPDRQHPLPTAAGFGMSDGALEGRPSRGLESHGSRVHPAEGGIVKSRRAESAGGSDGGGCSPRQGESRDTVRRYWGRPLPPCLEPQRGIGIRSTWMRPAFFMACARS